ncbi:MAG TPA: DUF4097 family beta strand repeat-containing protein [Verrucomicrobiae bacterium]|jgi:DUF4097 and DUF4098 domain-containing protein YvlB|nr:DUF4097 family beta strand repeat-containing protein [Verrucomicrobiae bacterium]
MKKIIAAIFCLGFLTAIPPAFAADTFTEKTITKTFTVQPGGDLNVDTDQGDIEVVTASQNTVDITVERELAHGGKSDLEKALKRQKVVFSQDNNTIRLEATTAKASHGLFSSAPPGLDVHIRVIVPRRFNATLSTAGGDVTVSNLQGTLDARTSGGDLTFTKIQGPVEGHTSGGNVKAFACSDKLTLQTSGGNIVIKDYTGPSAQGDTSGGNIDVTHCEGRLQVKTSGGNINIEGFAGPSAYADTSGGSINVGLAKEPTGDCWFSTSGGNITARLPGDAALTLHALTEGGAVNTSLPVTVLGKQKDGHLEGKINGGGPNLALKTSGGNIQLLKL